jgi:hypothetical protein
MATLSHTTITFHRCQCKSKLSSAVCSCVIWRRILLLKNFCTAKEYLHHPHSFDLAPSDAWLPPRAKHWLQVKVKLSLCLIKHHAMKAYSLTSALHGGEWSASRPGRFNPRERAPGTHWIGTQYKWVLGAWGYNWATQSPEDINMETWSSRLGVGRGANDPTPKKVNS